MDPSVSRLCSSRVIQKDDVSTSVELAEAVSLPASATFGSETSKSSDSLQRHKRHGSTPSKFHPSGALSTIKKAWGSMLEVGQTILRALSLNLIAHSFKSIRHFRGRGTSERTKVAIWKNRKIALLRSLVHIIPVGVALYEIILNWNTYYVGSTVYNLAFYQFLAKVHELTIQASVAAVTFSFVRSKMALGEGVPFGALFSGLQVVQISYLWSMEFWGSIRSEHLSVRRKLELLSIVSLSVLLATTCGPSSAVLLVPRLELWAAGSTHIWINATSQQLWPNRLDDSAVPTTCSVSHEHSVSNDCPSSEWQTIRDYLSMSKQILADSYVNTYHAIESPYDLQLKGKSSTRRLTLGKLALDGRSGAGCTTQQAAVADALTSTGALWFLSLNNVTARSGHGHSQSEQSDALHTIQRNNYQPFSAAFCAPDVIQDILDINPVAFPYIPTANQSYLINTNITYHSDSGSTAVAPGIIYSGLSRRQILETPGSISDYRLRWVELPEEAFNGSTIGAVILLPRPEKNSSQTMLLCNLAAGWGTVSLQMHTIAGGAGMVSSQTSLNGETISANKYPKGKYAIDPTGEEEEGHHFVFDYPSYPQKPINVSQAWAEYLNPRVASTNTSVFDTLMRETLSHADKHIPAEGVLVSMMTNGLARSSFTSNLQGFVKTLNGSDGSPYMDGNYWLSGKGDVFTVDAEESKDWVKLKVESFLQGYAYNTSNFTPRIAIAILTAYCLFAIGHILYAGITGISSTCWDSIAEVTALAMNSTPTSTLRNTCAGIMELHIFKLPVRILTFRDLEGEGEHLELVFGSVDEKDAAGRHIIQANRAYGTMPAPDDNYKHLKTVETGE